MKISLVGAELRYADGWTDGQTHTTKLADLFASLRNPLKK